MNLLHLKRFDIFGDLDMFQHILLQFNSNQMADPSCRRQVPLCFDDDSEAMPLVLARIIREACGVILEHRARHFHVQDMPFQLFASFLGGWAPGVPRCISK